MLKKTLLILFLLILLLASGCMNLQIKVDLDYPAPLFKQTIRTLNKLHRKDPYRKGHVSNLNVLLYNGEERKLIRVSFPIGLVDSELVENSGSRAREIRKYGKNYVNINFKGLKGLRPLGPGLLTELEISEEKTHIILWLD